MGTIGQCGIRNGRRALVLGFALAAASMVWADDVRFKLSGDTEVPPVSTKASGDAVLSVAADMGITGMVATTGVVGTMAHIHHGGAGANGPVLITLEKRAENGWAVPAGTKLTEEQFRLFKAGELYVNIHSAEHKGGEIRGQIAPAR